MEIPACIKKIDSMCDLMQKTHDENELELIRHNLDHLKCAIYTDFNLWEIAHSLLKIAYDKLNKKRAYLEYFSPPIETEITFMARKKAMRRSPHECSICYNHHTLYQTIVTDCGHAFGHKCFYNWAGPNNNSCPMCRRCVQKIKSVEINRNV